VDDFDGFASRPNRSARALTEPSARSTLLDVIAGWVRRDQDTARGGGTNRSVTRGRGSCQRRLAVSRRQHRMWHFATRTSVRISRSAQETRVVRV
jgi:hypothetical protein